MNPAGPGKTTRHHASPGTAARSRVLNLMEMLSRWTRAVSSTGLRARRRILAHTCLAGVIVCAAAAPLRGQSAEGSFAALSAADRADIQQLVARYPFALDGASPDGRAYAELFARDGTLVTATEMFTGRDELAAFAVRYHGANGGTRGFATNVVIEAVPGGASGKVYVVTIRPDPAGGPGTIVAGGHFEDRYVQTEQGWRFQRRQFFPSRLR